MIPIYVFLELCFYTNLVFFWAISLIRISIKQRYIATLFKWSRYVENLTSTEAGFFGIRMKETDFRKKKT